MKNIIDCKKYYKKNKIRLKDWREEYKSLKV